MGTIHAMSLPGMGEVSDYDKNEVWKFWVTQFDEQKVGLPDLDCAAAATTNIKALLSAASKHTLEGADTSLLNAMLKISEASAQLKRVKGKKLVLSMEAFRSVWGGRTIVFLQIVMQWTIGGAHM